MFILHSVGNFKGTGHTSEVLDCSPEMGVGLLNVFAEVQIPLKITNILLLES